MNEKQKAEFAQANELGATGHFALGKLNPEDEGELSIAVGCDQGKVFLAFGKPTAWLAMGPREALALAEAITKQAARCGS